MYDCAIKHNGRAQWLLRLIVILSHYAQLFWVSPVNELQTDYNIIINMSLAKLHEKIALMQRKIDQGYPLFEDGLRLRNKVNNPADSRIAMIVIMINIVDKVPQLQKRKRQEILI